MRRFVSGVACAGLATLVGLGAQGCGHRAAKAPTGMVCLGGTPSAVRVGDCDIPSRSVRYGAALRGGARRDLVLHALVERELLAQGALEAGETPPAIRDVQAKIEAGEVYFLGERPATVPYFRDARFDLGAFRNLVGSLGLASADELIDEQGRELLAQRMRERLSGRGPDGRRQLDEWLQRRCRELSAAGRIRVAPDMAPASFEPCAAPGPPEVDLDALQEALRDAGT